ncbi:MAG: 50S ribosomal protein L32e [Candidatus Thermoplasmatota archaeon]|jgi:large subunit ribosomal protein L32e|nr:50S ribosomal protein L32e [Candidatus Thermoplasmatota archaeon]
MTKEAVLKEFEALKGVGKAKAKLLYDNGYDSLEKLKKAKIKDLTKLKGVSEKNAKEIIDQLKVKKEKPVKKTDEKKEQAEQPEKKEEAVEIVEQQKGAYHPKIKPQLNEQQKEQLVIRRQIKKRTPHFLRDEGFRYKRIPKNWRRPTGYTSKLRINLKYRPSKVRVGFRAPKIVRGLHASGFEEVMVHTVKELDTIDPKKQAVRIGGTVGTKKRLDIAKRADELAIRVLNMGES